MEQALFASTQANETPQSAGQSGQNLLAVLEVCQNILHEQQETKTLLYQVGGIALDLQETKEAQEKAQQERVQQEMGMWLFSQFLQNPDAVDKVAPVLERFANTAKQEEQAKTNVRPAIEPPANRATRRKKSQ